MFMDVLAINMTAFTGWGILKEVKVNIGHDSLLLVHPGPTLEWIGKLWLGIARPTDCQLACPSWLVKGYYNWWRTKASDPYLMSWY